MALPRGLGAAAGAPTGRVRAAALLISLALSVCRAAVLTSQNLPIAYLAFTSKLVNVSRGVHVHTYSEFESIDDSPFVPLPLPFPFLFGNRLVQAVFINPNGAIHMSKSQPCYPDNTYGTNTCTLANSYYSVIAGYLNDFDGNNCSHSSIASFQSNTSFSLAFSDVCYYNSSLRSSFTINLFPDHHIVLDYLSIANASAFQRVGAYASGYRLPRSYSQSTGLQVDVQQGLVANYVWRTTAGVYPSRLSDLRGGRSLTICPFSSVLRVSPQTVYLAEQPSAMVDVQLDVSSVLLSCLDQIQYFMGFATTVSAAANVTTALPRVLCRGQGANSSLLRCNGSALVSAGYAYLQARPSALNVTYWVQLFWLPSSASGINPVPIYFSLPPLYNNSPPSLQALSMTPLPVVLHRASPTAANSSAGCAVNFNDPCVTATMCAANQTCYAANTCLNASAHPWNDSPDTDVYPAPPPQRPAGVLSALLDVLDCAGRTCPHELDGTEPAYFQRALPIISTRDIQNYCCNLTALDCAGFCLDSNPYVATLINRVGRSRDNATVTCCSVPNRLDCHNICGGTATRDACGVCGGTDTVGLSCFNPADVHVLLSEGTALAFALPDAANRTVRALVTNNSTSEISLSVKQNPTVNQASRLPSLTVNGSGAVLRPNESCWVLLHFSVASALSPNGPAQSAIVGWEAKNVLFTYFRTAYSPSTFSQNVTFFPEVVAGCSQADSLTSCMSLPGCMHCLTYDRMRLVKSNRHSLTWNSRQKKPRTAAAAKLKKVNEAYVGGDGEVEWGEEELGEGEEELGEGELGRSSRRLFSSIVPAKFNNKGHDLLAGECREGWEADTCDYIGDTFVVSAAPIGATAVGALTTATAVMALGLWLLLGG